MLLDLAAVAAGVLILVYAADAFVVGAGRLALALRVSPIVVGAVVIGFGTSAPELMASALAAAQGSLPIAVGNIVGSNIANVTLVAGIAALMSPLVVSSTTLRREAPIMVAGVALLAVLVQGSLVRLEGVVLLVGLAVVLTWLLLSDRPGDDPIGAEAQARSAPETAGEMAGEWGRTIVALAGVLAAAQLIVFGARGVAEEAGLSEGFVGLTIVAVGTSLPEIVTSAQAARRRQHDLIVGNLLGSNIFNSLAIGGVVALIGPGAVDDQGLQLVAVGAMIAASLAAWLLLATRRRLSRWEGAVLLLAYLVLLPFMA